MSEAKMKNERPKHKRSSSELPPDFKALIDRFKNIEGVVHLVVILLVLSNLRVALENINKYGILVDPLSWLLFFFEGSKHWPAILIIAILGLHILISFSLEKLIVSGLPLVFSYGVMLTNLLACLSLPPFIINSFDTHPISASASLMLVSIVSLKLVSYHMINYWCRDIKLCKRDNKLYSRTTRTFLSSYTPPQPMVEFSEATTTSSSSSNGIHSNNKSNRQPRSKEFALQTLAKYPNNLSLRDICEFMLFPTLCYEVQFARTERLRKRFLIKRFVELIMLAQLDLALIQQWIVPTVTNSVVPFKEMQFSHMLERLLKLAIPNHIIWLIWFYLFFHTMLNIVAELTRFAEREFYRDWWNSQSVYQFWSHWNVPVHKWCVRHLYLPLIALGFNKCQASTAVFCVSAFFHEYLVSVPLKIFRIWAFTGMLMQLPYARFVSAYFNKQFANVAVWISLIIGQPLCILMYYHDYYVINKY